MQTRVHFLKFQQVPFELDPLGKMQSRMAAP